MDFNRTSRRSFLESIARGAASLALAGTAYLAPSYALSSSSAYAQDAPISPELKEKANIIEVMPNSKQIVSNNTGRKVIPPIRDMKFANEIKPFPKADLDTLLAEDKTPKPNPQKETSQDTEKRAYELLQKYSGNVATIFYVNKNEVKGGRIQTSFITPEFIVAPYRIAEIVIKENKTLHYILPPEFQNISEELEVFASSQEKNIVLLHTKNPNNNVTIPNIAINDIYQGEKLIGIYGRFPEGNEPNKQIKFNEDLVTFPYKTTKFRIDENQKVTNFSNCGFKYTLSIGYASQPLKENGILQIGPGDPTLNDFTITAFMHTEIGNLGMPIFDTKRKLAGISLTKITKPNSGEMLHPIMLRTFLTQYQTEALKRTQQAVPKKK